MRVCTHIFVQKLNYWLIMVTVKFCCYISLIKFLLLLVKATFEVAHKKANKALETSDLSTTDADADDGGNECSQRAHHTPDRYSPTHLSTKKNASNTSCSLQPPVAPPGLLLASAALVQPSTSCVGPASKPLRLPSGC